MTPALVLVPTASRLINLSIRSPPSPTEAVAQVLKTTPHVRPTKIFWWPKSKISQKTSRRTSIANKFRLTRSVPTRTPTITRVASPTPQTMFWMLSRKWQMKTSRWRNARSCARITSTLVSTMASIACVGTNSQTQRKRSLRPIVTVFAEVTSNRNVEETPGYRSTRSRLRTVSRLGWQWRRLTKSGSSPHRSSTSKEEQQGSSKLYLLKSNGCRSNLMFSMFFISSWDSPCSGKVQSWSLEIR